LNYTYIVKIDKNQIGIFRKKIITTTVILTYERLNNHILKYHKDEFSQIKSYLKSIVENPDYVIEDNMHNNTLIYLKHINEINKKARIVIKLATDSQNKIYNLNSIITIMRQRDRSWVQTINNRGKIIYSKLDKNE